MKISKYPLLQIQADLHNFQEKMKARDVANTKLYASWKLQKKCLFGTILTHYTTIFSFREDNRRACGKFVRRVTLPIEEVRLAASHFPSSKRGCRKLMINDSLTAAAPAAAAQSTSRRKCATSFVPAPKKHFTAVHNQPRGAGQFTAYHAIHSNDTIYAHRRPDISKFTRLQEAARNTNAVISARFPGILIKYFAEPLRRSKSTELWFF